jgi:hypothetical protein
VIRHYRLDRACFVGRPNPSFAYMLAKGGSPTGAMAGEDCVAFDPETLKVGNIQGRWKIVSGRRWLFDFGGNETDARRPLPLSGATGSANPVSWAGQTPILPTCVAERQTSELGDGAIDDGCRKPPAG